MTEDVKMIDAEYEFTFKCRISWDKLKAPRKKLVFKYLLVRFQEMTYLKKKVFDRAIEFPTSSPKKDEYKKVFDRIWDMLDDDETYNCILIGVQRWIQCNYDDAILGAILGDAVNCAICFDELMTPNREARMLGCRHVFHTDCLRLCLEQANRCPVCRTPL